MGAFRALTISLAFAALGFAFEARGQVSVSVLQTNIHRDIGGSDSNTSAQSALAQEINYFNPDVWTLQELGGNNVSYNATTAYNDLVAFIQSDITIFGSNPIIGTNFYVSLSSLDDNYDTVAIVSRYPFLSTQTYSDAGGGYSALRGMAMVQIDIPGTVNLDIFTMHLKASSADSDAARRQAEAAANSTSIAGWIARNPNDAVVVTGDFNETTETNESANWSNHSLGDSISINGKNTTYNPVATLKAAGLSDPRPVSLNGSIDTISSSSPNTRFDYALYGSNLTYTSGLVFNSKLYSSMQLATMNAARGTSLTTSTSSTASDHLAVFETFAVVPEPEAIVLLGLAGAMVVLRAGAARPRRWSRGLPAAA